MGLAGQALRCRVEPRWPAGHFDGGPLWRLPRQAESNATGKTGGAEGQRSAARTEKEMGGNLSGIPEIARFPFERSIASVQFTGNIEGPRETAGCLA